MIKSNIQRAFPHHTINNLDDDVYVVDYTAETQGCGMERGVEFISPNKPIDITFLSINNPLKLKIDGVAFDNFIFVCNNKPKTQCEALFYPNISNENSWVLFCELKYNNNRSKNCRNLKKAIKQLYKTHYYYVQENVICHSNTRYLIVAFPTQEPCPSFAIPPFALTKMKKKRNIIFRPTNKVTIKDDLTLHV